jgi:hypothetical protein
MKVHPEAMDGASLPVRVGVSVLYWPVVVAVALFWVAATPVVYVYQVWGRTLDYLGYWDEPLPIFLTFGTFFVPMLLIVFAVDRGWISLQVGPEPVYEHWDIRVHGHCEPHAHRHGPG